MPRVRAPPALVTIQRVLRAPPHGALGLHRLHLRLRRGELGLRPLQPRPQCGDLRVPRVQPLLQLQRVGQGEGRVVCSLHACVVAVHAQILQPVRSIRPRTS
uniref:Uncharacterized protein n=1 Tax=Triticum urartu TaxID=4572 RepID=A0A8R7QXL6_TRIUA